ncbi:MAG TPA: DinB family protein [Candidatus Acidoferrales bacterium]
MDLTPTLNRLAYVRAQFLEQADSVAPPQWKHRPGPSRWSAAEVATHLAMVEDAIITKAGDMISHPPRPFPVWKRLHLPLFVIDARLGRRETPIPLDPKLVADKEEMLARLREVRHRTVDFLERTDGRDFSAYYFPHPFIGGLNLPQWFEVIWRHELRHTKQLREIVESFQK